MEKRKWGKTMLSNPAPSDRFFKQSCTTSPNPASSWRPSVQIHKPEPLERLHIQKVTTWKNEGDGQEVNIYLYWLFSVFFNKFRCLLKLMESFYNVRKYILWKLKSSNWLKIRTINKKARLVENFTKLSGYRVHPILNKSSTILVGLPLIFINCR